MRRSPIPLIAAVLAAVSAITLLRAAQAITAGLPMDEPIATNRALAYRFYEAVNVALLTGDTGPFGGLVTDDYAEPDHAGAEPGAEGLRQRLAALHATHPDLELVVTDVLVRRNLVVARLDVRGGTEASFAGAPLSGTPPPWGPIDFLRVDDGRIAERRSAGAIAPHLLPLWEAQLDDPPVVAQLALARLSLAPGGTTSELRNPGPALIAVESGTLRIAVAAGTGPNPETVANARGHTDAVGQEATALDPGEPIVLPIATPYTLRNDGPTTAVALVVALFQRVSSERAAPALTPAEAASVALLLHGLAPAWNGTTAKPGITVRYLGGGPLYGLPSAAMVLAGGRVTLPPGSSLPLPATAGTTLLAVEAGAGEIAIEGGLAQTRHERTAEIVSHNVGDDPTLGQTAALADGGMALMPLNATGTLRNSRNTPVRALLLRVAPSAPTGEY